VCVLTGVAAGGGDAAVLQTAVRLRPLSEADVLAGISKGPVFHARLTNLIGTACQVPPAASQGQRAAALFSAVDPERGPRPWPGEDGPQHRGEDKDEDGDEDEDARRHESQRQCWNNWNRN
jgi:hypothetical protein